MTVLGFTVSFLLFHFITYVFDYRDDDLNTRRTAASRQPARHNGLLKDICWCLLLEQHLFSSLSSVKPSTTSAESHSCSQPHISTSDHRGDRPWASEVTNSSGERWGNT